MVLPSPTPPPAPSTVVPPPASSEDPFPTRKPGDSPTYGPCRTFTVLHSPRRCRPRMGILGPSGAASLPASCAACPCLAWSTPLPLPLPASEHTLGRPSSPGWLELLLQSRCGPRTRLQHTHPISWKRPPAWGLGPCRVRGTSVEVTTDALPSPPHPRRAWAFHP